jgi:hypothetical protein
MLTRWSGVGWGEVGCERSCTCYASSSPPPSWILRGASFVLAQTATLHFWLHCEALLGSLALEGEKSLWKLLSGSWHVCVGDVWQLHLNSTEFTEYFAFAPTVLNCVGTNQASNLDFPQSHVYHYFHASLDGIGNGQWDVNVHIHVNNSQKVAAMSKLFHG